MVGAARRRFAAGASLLALLSIACVLGSSCAEVRRCEGPELCNGLDDDCDGLVDEDFVDSEGLYVADQHCGRCGVSCDEVFATAATTRCEVVDGEAQCALKLCPPGTHQVQSQCLPDQPVLCLPCVADADCAARSAGAKCMDLSGDGRCGRACDGASPCPEPFACEDGQCVPAPALCACEGVEESFEVACLSAGSVDDGLCAGVATCGPLGLSRCEVSAGESCNGLDDDCDGLVDEDFVDEAGRYVSRLHCGACGSPCAPPGVHYEASCVVSDEGARCEIACEEGFVDVDGIEASGCECQRFDGDSAPLGSGGDMDCDGVVDDDDAFVHVSTAGRDDANGTLRTPMRTIQAALDRALREGKAVLVAQGVYEAFELVPGVSVFGGYRTDFRARDPALYVVSVEQRLPEDGAPVLTCRGLASKATVDGFTLVGGDAVSAGQGSTAVLLDGCGPQVTLSNLTVLSGRGAAGASGDDAIAIGVSSGQDGAAGRASSAVASCDGAAGGAGGALTCGARDVSGGAGGDASCVETGCRNGQPCANGGCADFTTGGDCDYARVLELAVANPTAQPGAGQAPGQPGAPTYNAPTSRRSCSFCEDNPTLPRLGEDGEDGLDGSWGEGGSGCDTSTLVLDALGRARGLSGSAGQTGEHGSGGGGGSAGAGYDVIRGTSGSCQDVPGGSGGGGGSGGCGARGGSPGGGGGASVAILLRPNASGEGPTFTSVRVVTESGGRGGAGGAGGAGGRGGRGGVGGQSSFWCARSGGRGGDGGAGGSGGGGGGGCGGSSHALVFATPVFADYAAEVELAVRADLAGVPGAGGRGGFSQGNPGSAGRAGLGARVLQLGE